MERGENYDRPEVALKNGTVLGADLGVSGNAMWIWIRDRADPYNSLTALTGLLSQPGVTDTVARIQRGEVIIYEGYTLLTNVKYYQSGLVCARLEKEADDV